MGRGNGLGSDHCLTFSVLMLNVTIGLLGLLLFCLAVWMRFEGDVRVWISELGMYQYWTGLYILMAASIVIVLISICGCGGTLTANPGLLGVSAVFVLVAVILELAGGIYIVVHGSENSKLTPWLEKKFSKLIVDSNYNDRALNILQTVQEKVGCCGALSYQDYDRNRLPISDYCRDKISGNVFRDGCVKRFSIFIERRAGWLAGIALFTGFLQIILVGLTFWHWKRVRETNDDYFPSNNKSYYDPVPTKTR